MNQKGENRRRPNSPEMNSEHALVSKHCSALSNPLKPPLVCFKVDKSNKTQRSPRIFFIDGVFQLTRLKFQLCLLFTTSFMFRIEKAT